MAREIYDSEDLMGVIREADSIPSYWLDLLFPGQINFDDEYVDFEKIPRNKRKLAPFVLPMSQGKPIFEEGSTIGRFKPAYIKPKDPINPTRVIKRRPGEILQRVPDSPEQRYNAVVADITLQHNEAIRRRWEWLASQLAQFGQVTISGEGVPTRLIDFQRAANHTVIKTAGTFWGEAGVSIIDDIQTWSDRMQLSPFGGPPSVMTIGSEVARKFRRDAEIKDLLDTTFKGSDGTDFNRGLHASGQVVTLGVVGNLRIDIYSDFFEVGGVSTPFMDPRDIVLSGPAFEGIKCFGAILDPNASYQPLEMFPRNYIENDPPVPFIMTQSNFLPVSLNPNATLRARVVA